MLNIIQPLINFTIEYSYLAIFIFLFSLSFALPISEEVALTIVGFITFQGYAEIHYTLLVSYCGIIAGDLFLYGTSRILGRKLFEIKPLNKLISPQKILSGEKFFIEHGAKTIFISRFIMGFRVTMLIVAGFLKMDLKKFILYDSLAALIFVPLLVLSGFFLGNQFKQGITIAERISYFVLAAALVITLIILVKKIKKQNFNKN